MVTLNVLGMHCTSCELILKEDVGAVSGISNAKADYKAGVVSFDGPKSALADVKAAIEKNGYSVQ